MTTSRAGPFRFGKLIVLHRSARTGRFVTASFAKRRPATTIKERIWRD